MVKMRIQSLLVVRWLYSVLCVHSPESTSLKIGESMKTGASIDIAAGSYRRFVSAKIFLCEAL
jgi:hypothetical protein